MISPPASETAARTLRPLPIRPRPAAGERPASYARRLARANHLRPGYLRRHLADPDQPGEIRLDWLAALAGRTPAALRKALTSQERSPQRTAQPSRTALFTAIRRDAARNLSIRALAERHGVHRRTIHQALRSPAPPPRKPAPPRPSRLDPFKSVIDDLLEAERDKHPRDRLTIKAIRERLVTEHGATGISYSTVSNYVTNHRPTLRAGAAMTHYDCPFCGIAAGESDQDLIVLRTDRLFVIPTLRQRPGNLGQVIVLPVAHLTGLHEADTDLLTDMFAMVSRITAAMPAAFDASGSTVLQNNHTPDQVLHHLHVHVIPRFAGDDFVIPNSATEPAPQHLRANITRRLRQALN